jgi:small subunit ribosomal protein S13
LARVAASIVFIAGYCFVIIDLSAYEYKHILRIAGKDIEGSKKLIVALSEIKGVGYNFAQVLTQSLNINPNMRVGFLTENEIRDIEQAISNPARAGVPQWYLNRRKNMDDGSNHHLITSDLDFAASNDIEREKLVMSWRGYRHMFGLRVRGQCTRTTGRKGGAVGVKKVKLMPGAAAPEAPTAPATPSGKETAKQPTTPAAGGPTNPPPSSKEPAKK